MSDADSASGADAAPGAAGSALGSGREAAAAGPDGGTAAGPAAPGAEAGARAGAATAPAAGASTDADTGSDADAAPDAATGRDADTGADRAPAAAGRGSAAEPDAARPDTDAEGPAPAETDADATDEAPAGDDPAATPADGGAPADGGSDASGGDARGVDQATAVFRAPKPPVDQPTTTLKIGEQARPGTRGTKTGAAATGAAAAAPGPAGTAAPESAPAAAASGKAAADESPAERTSKFVALKALDERAAPGRTGTDTDAPRPAAEGPERTRQQPLPPLPPLDLLAELTNTPPPPQTPMRTVLRRVKIWTPLVLLLLVVVAVAQALRPLPDPTLSLTADPEFGFGGSAARLPWPGEGQGWLDVGGLGTMDHFGAQKPVPIGSVAKAMTAYLILKDKPLKRGAEGPGIPVDATAEKEGGYDVNMESTLNTIKEGDTLTERQALAAIMIPSANNVARMLARWDAGSGEAFVAKMNAAARKLGMDHTTYTDPSGLDATTVSTAEDQVKLGNELVKFPALTDITKLPSWKDPSGHVWTNFNRLVPYDNAIGLKTGTTTKAGGNLLFAGTKETGGETVIVVGAILGQHKSPIIDTVNAVSRTALVAAQDALTSRTILKKGDVVGYVDDGLGGHTPVAVTKDVSAVGWAGLTVRLKLADDGRTIAHDAPSGTRVGTLTVGDSSGGAVGIPIALQKDLTKPGLDAKLTRLG